MWESFQAQLNYPLLKTLKSNGIWPMTKLTATSNTCIVLQYIYLCFVSLNCVVNQDSDPFPPVVKPQGQTSRKFSNPLIKEEVKKTMTYSSLQSRNPSRPLLPEDLIYLGYEKPDPSKSLCLESLSCRIRERQVRLDRFILIIFLNRKVKVVLTFLFSFVS